MLLAGIIFWLVSLCTFTVHVGLTLKGGIVDFASYITATLLLIAGLCWAGRPRTAMTYYIGGITLLACTVRTVRTAWAQYHTHTGSIDMSQFVPFTIVISLFMIVLIWNYLFSKASRAYFSI